MDLRETDNYLGVLCCIWKSVFKSRCGSVCGRFVHFASAQSASLVRHDFDWVTHVKGKKQSWNQRDVDCDRLAAITDS